MVVETIKKIDKNGNDITFVRITDVMENKGSNYINTENRKLNQLFIMPI